MRILILIALLPLAVVLASLAIPHRKNRRGRRMIRLLAISGTVKRIRK